MTRMRILGICLSLFLLALGINLAFAQSADLELVLTWQANNSFVPSTYTGKILPNLNSEVLAALTLLENNRPVSLSNYEIRWFFNQTKLASGRGLTALAIPGRTAPYTGNHALRAEVRNYKGKNLTGTTIISYVEPRVIISAPFINRQLPKVGALVSGLPYFFTIKSAENLNYRWRVQNQESFSKGDTALAITTTGGEAGAPLLLELEASNALYVDEVASAKQTFFLP